MNDEPHSVVLVAECFLNNEHCDPCVSFIEVSETCDYSNYLEYREEEHVSQQTGEMDKDGKLL